MKALDYVADLLAVLFLLGGGVIAVGYGSAFADFILQTGP